MYIWLDVHARHFNRLVTTQVIRTMISEYQFRHYPIWPKRVFFSTHSETPLSQLYMGHYRLACNSLYWIYVRGIHVLTAPSLPLYCQIDCLAFTASDHFVRSKPAKDWIFDRKAGNPISYDAIVWWFVWTSGSSLVRDATAVTAIFLSARNTTGPKLASTFNICHLVFGVLNAFFLSSF